MSDIAHPRPSLIHQCLANIDELKKLSESLENGEDKSTLLSSKARESISLLHHLLDHETSPDQHALKRLTTKITELELLIGKKRHSSAVADSLFQKLFQQAPLLIEDLKRIEVKMLYQQTLVKAIGKMIALFPFLSIPEKARLSHVEYESLLNLLERRDSGADLKDFENTQLASLTPEMVGAISSMASSYIHLVTTCETLLDLVELEAAVREKRATPEQIRCIIDSKKWAIECARTETTLLNFNVKEIYNTPTSYFGFTSLIENIARLQSEEIDKVILEDLLAIHNDHISAGGGSMHVVVEGAGAVGLYSALKAFLAGANVTVVNDRSEEYSRKQILYIDRVWKGELRYFLGTKYKDLFGEEIEGEGIPVRLLEDLLKVRMVELSSFLEGKEEGFLTLHYELDMKEIVANESRTGYQIRVGPSQKSSAMSQYEEEAIKRRAETLLRTEYADKAPAEGGISLFDEAYQKATSEYSLEKEVQKSASYSLIEGDLLICCGGTHDRMRSEYLSPIISYTKPQFYQVGVFRKMEDLAEMPESPRLRSLISAATFLRVESMERFELEIEPVIADYRAMSQIANRDKDKAFTQFGLRIINSGNYIQCSIVVPESMRLLLEDLKKERSLVDPADTPLLEKYDDLKNEIIKYGLYNFCPVGYKVDSSIISSAIFSLEQTGGITMSAVLRGESGSLIVTCAGDSLISPHFYSGTGLTTGRDAVDMITKVVEDAHRGWVPSSADFIERLDEALPLVTQTALRMGQDYVLPRDIKEVKNEAYQATLKQILKLDEETLPLSLEDRGYKINSVDRAGSSFVLGYLDGKRIEHQVLVTITEEGKLVIPEDETPYTTVKTLILTLQNR